MRASNKIVSLFLLGVVAQNYAMEREDADQYSKKIVLAGPPFHGTRPKPLVAVVDQVPCRTVDERRLGELVELLSSASCINDFNSNGDTVLHVTCKNSDLSQAIILARAILTNKHFSSINVKNRGGKTSLQLLIIRFVGCVASSDVMRIHSLVQLLRKNGACDEELSVPSRQIESIELAAEAPKTKKIR